MEYLNKVLGIKVTYEDVEFKHLPNFIVMRYRLQMVSTLTTLVSGTIKFLQKVIICYLQILLPTK